MELTLQTYIEFICEGFCFSKNRIQIVKNRDLDLPNHIRRPQNAYGFRFFDIHTMYIMYEGEKILLKSERMNYSRNYYMSDGVYTLEEFREAFSKSDKVYSLERFGEALSEEEKIFQFLEISGCKEIALCRTGNFVPLTKEDRIVEPV